MSEETKKPDSIHIPVDWSKCYSPDKIKYWFRDVDGKMKYQKTEDADFEIIEPLQLPESKK